MRIQTTVEMNILLTDFITASSHLAVISLIPQIIITAIAITQSMIQRYLFAKFITWFMSSLSPTTQADWVELWTSAFQRDSGNLSSILFSILGVSYEIDL
jgi:hypothetical protein